MTTRRGRLAVLFVLTLGLVFSSTSFINNLSQPSPFTSSKGPSIMLGTNLNSHTETNYWSAMFNPPEKNGIVGHDYHHDTSPPLRDMPQIPPQPATPIEPPAEANPNPSDEIGHADVPDASAVQRSLAPKPCLPPTSTSMVSPSPA